MTKRKKKIALEDIPEVLEKAVTLMNQEITNLSNKPSLSNEEAKLLIAYCDSLTSMYRDYRTQEAAIKSDLKKKSPEELLQLVKIEGK